MSWFDNLFGKKKRGPFEANRILDTKQTKVDQIFTRSGEKPVGLFIHTPTDEARKLGLEGYAGPTKMGAKGYYEDDRSWVTRAIYFPNNISGGVITEDIKNQMRRSLSGGGTLVPGDISFEQVNDSHTIPVSGSANIDVEPDGTTKISGDVIIWDSEDARTE